MVTVVSDGCPGHEGGKARHRWHAMNATQMVALVLAGAAFCDGVLAECPEPAAA
jgi:hypothetical protein